MQNSTIAVTPIEDPEFRVNHLRRLPAGTVYSRNDLEEHVQEITSVTTREVAGYGPFCKLLRLLGDAICSKYHA